MPSSAALRLQIERDLQHRYPSALTPSPRTIREVGATGIEALDEMLHGGLPVGAISELTGPPSSGKTTVALAFLSQRIRDNSVCAWVDSRDSFDPESAAANGISLQHLLWVRCTDTKTETQSSSPRKKFNNTQPWSRLDQAIRATDLLLQAGGFASIVLDLAGESPEHAGRIPLATWFRFRQAADRTRCSLIVLGRTSYARSSAALVLECTPKGLDKPSTNTMRGFSYTAHRGRERFVAITQIDRKPPVSVWSAIPAWDLEERA